MTPSALINKNSSSKQIHFTEKNDKNEYKAESGNTAANLHNIIINENQPNLEKHRNYFFKLKFVGIY